MERYREMMPQTESIIRWNWVEEQSGADGLKDRVGSYVARVKWRVENHFLERFSKRVVPREKSRPGVCQYSGTGFLSSRSQLYFLIGGI